MESTVTDSNYKRHINNYLQELKTITGHPVLEKQVVDLDKIEVIRSQASRIDKFPVSKITIPFSDKVSKRFSHFVEQMREKNASPIYIWTQNTNSCGLFKIDNISQFDFSFPFEINKEGIIVFLASNFRDKLILDFSLNEKSEQVLEVEAQGENWPSLVY